MVDPAKAAGAPNIRKAVIQNNAKFITLKYRPSAVIGKEILGFSGLIWVHGIHPPEPRRLKFFNDKRFEVITALWQRFCKRLSAKDKKAAKVCAIKPVDQRSTGEGCIDRETFEYEASAFKPSRESEHWRWIRVYEYYKERYAEQRYEMQQRAALRIMERSRINPKLIKYIS